MKRALTAIAAILMLTACNHTNPFLTEWDTPYGIPPFDKIKVSDYIPAIKAGIEQQQAEIDAITACAEAERSLHTASRQSSISTISSIVTGAPASPSTQQMPLHASRSQQNRSVRISDENSTLPT